MIYSINLTVRDYECDLQGIVNNSVYQNYYEHCRHQFLLSKNMDFKDLVDQGIYLVLIRSEIDYKYSLTSHNDFIVTIDTIERISKFKSIFKQSIILKDKDFGDILVSKAVFTVVGLDRFKKPVNLDMLESVLVS